MSNNKNFRKINLNHIPVFAAIAETRSITAAARLLGAEKTRVSRILAEFENDLNAELVYRTTRDLRLTTEGERFYGRCKKILSDLEDATHGLSRGGDEATGHIRLTGAHGIASSLLPQAIKEFNKLHPRVTFEIILTQQILNLVKEGIDVAFRVGALEDSAYKSKKIGICPFAFAATPYFLSSNSPVGRIEDLSSAPTIALPSFDRRPLVFRKPGSIARLKLSSSIVCNSPTVILDLTLKDLGIGLLPELTCRDHFRTGRLVRIFEQWNTDPVPISLLFHASARKKTHVSLFIAFLSSGFGKLYLSGAMVPEPIIHPTPN
jgi:LysR family transcriptional regulator, regulator for bpeEF and oprC